MEAQQDIDSFCADVVNAVQDYCDDGIDAFESCLEGAEQLDAQTKQTITQGSDELHQDLTSKVSGSLALFVELCKTTVLTAPIALQLPQAQVPEGQPDADLASLQDRRAQLEARLEGLRAQISQEDRECNRLAAKLQAMDAQIQKHGHVAGVQAVATALSSSGTGTAGSAAADVAAITEAKKRLESLLGKAWNLTAHQMALAKGAAGPLRSVAGGRPLLGSVENILPL